MKKLKMFIRGQLVTMFIYLIVYLVTSFVIWDFKNPFQWILDLPKADIVMRCGVLIVFVFYYSCLYITMSDIQKEKDRINDLK